MVFPIAIITFFWLLITLQNSSDVSVITERYNQATYEKKVRINYM